MKTRHMLVALGIAMLAMPMVADAGAGPLRDLLAQRGDRTPIVLSTGVRVLRDVAYGDDPAQRLDVYAPSNAHDVPVIFMVHGGAWAFGDKNSARVVQGKMNRWLPRGIVFISVGYPMLPQADPLAQARSVAKALAYAQRHAAEWGADPRKFVLMGHSAGAHLVALISAEPSLATSQGAQPWLGTVALDSAAYDIAAIMRTRHPPLYEHAFGSDPAFWTQTSPPLQLHGRIAPFLAVCSSLRADSCPQAQRFVDKATSLGSQARTLPQPLRHEQINEQLGQPSDYTAQVEAFMAGLDPALAKALKAQPQ